MNRFERLLYKLAQKYTPQQIPRPQEMQANPADPTAHIRRLARRLAFDGVLVLVGEVPPEVRTAQIIHVEDWVQSYSRLYRVLTEALLPSYAEIEAFYADSQMPVAVVLRGQALPVLGIMAGYIVPYVALRQDKATQSSAEVSALIDLMLKALAADDLTPAQTDDLKMQCAGAIKRIMNATLKQISLTDFERPALALVRRPRQQAEPSFDMTYIETDDPQTPSEQLFRVPLPTRNPSGTPSTSRRPPVPPLPDDGDDSTASDPPSGRPINRRDR